MSVKHPRALRFSRWALPAVGALIFLGADEPTAVAADSFPIDVRSLVEVRSLDALPKEVNELLGRWKPGPDGMADAYEPFNQTDVIDPKLPARRFMSAGSNLHAVLVAYEKGGHERTFVASAFSFEHSAWRQVGSWTLPRSANTLYRLLDLVAPSRNDASSLLATLKRQMRTQDTRPVRRDGPLRTQNLSDDEVREIESIAQSVMPGGLVNVSGVVTGCPCEEGANCSDQVWTVVYRPDQTKGLQLSRLSGHWAIGAVQQWWLDYDSLWARRPWPPTAAFDAELNSLYDRFPACSGPPTSPKAASMQPSAR
jgi:hypothetical protein